MKPESRRRCTANMRAVTEENGSIFASAASAMLESGLLRHNVRARCLLCTPTAERWKLRCSKSGLKTNSWTDYRKGTSSSWIMRRFIKKRSCRTLRENTRRPWFFYRRIHWNTIHWTHVERVETKSCRLRSSLWLRFTGSGCRFRRQL